MIQQPMTDPILDEIHRTRREMSEKFGGDFTKMLADARRRQEASGRPIWQPHASRVGSDTDLKAKPSPD